MRVSFFFVLFFLSSLSFGASHITEITGVIGHGTAGQVVVVKNPRFSDLKKSWTNEPGEDDDSLALKLPNTPADPREAVYSLDTREIEAYKALKHANLVSYCDEIHWNKTPTYTLVGVLMRLYDGDLHQLMSDIQEKKIDFFTDRGRLQYLRGLFRGLAYMHSQGFSHGDIRPANCFCLGKVVVIGDYSHVTKKEDHELGQALLKYVFQYPVDETLAPSTSGFSSKTCQISLKTRQSLDVFGLAMVGLEWMYPTEFQKKNEHYQIYRLDRGSRSVPVEFRKALYHEMTHEDGTAKLSETYHPSNQELGLRQDLLELLCKTLRVGATLTQEEWVSRTGESELGSYTYEMERDLSAEEVFSELLELTDKYPTTPETPLFRHLKMH